MKRKINTAPGLQEVVLTLPTTWCHLGIPAFPTKKLGSIYHTSTTGPKHVK